MDHRLVPALAGVVKDQSRPVLVLYEGPDILQRDEVEGWLLLRLEPLS